ncbi:endo-alpha-N-acetylgalactosaminidase family protein [Eubacterium ramulus]
MRKKLVVRMLCLAMAASMIGTMVPTSLYPVVAHAETAGQEASTAKAVLEDGIRDKWTQDNLMGFDSVCKVEDGWLHLRSSVDNGNNPGTKPAMFVNSKEFNFNEAGYFDFTLKPANGDGRFGVYLGYNSDRVGMMIGYDSGGWFWQKYGASGDPWYSGSRVASPASGVETNVHIEWTADKKVSVKIGDQVVFSNEDFSGITGLGNKIAFKGGTYSSAVTDVYLKNIHYTGQAEAKTYAVTGKVQDQDGKAISNATVTVEGQSVRTGEDGSYSLTLATGNYEMTVARDGYETVVENIAVTDADTVLDTVSLVKSAEVETEKLSTEDMDVFVSKTFPSVVKYEMKGDLAGKVFYGQSEKINTVRINNRDIQLDDADVKATFEGNKATYVMTVKGDSVDAVITAELVAEKNTLAFNITDIKNNLEDSVTGNPIQTIEIPDQSLVSVRSSQEGANFKGAAMSSNTRISGDTYTDVTMDTSMNNDYMYGFVSNNELSAGLWSNSEHDGSSVATSVTGGSKNTRVQAVTQKKQDYVSLGLGSCAWYYHRVVTDSHNRNFMVTETDMPKAKIIISGDMNDDSKIDWQDGAVSFRSIMNNPYKCEEVPELVAYRIAMNFGGQAQNPFLTSLDNVKRVALNTDGLGQSVLLKGYANEGHDSAHPDYADIGKRIGGAEDMNTLLTEGAKYGARFGIHVNAGEMYPEAKAFKDDNVRRDYNGNLRYGWNWLDQAIGLDSIYDLATGDREKRFDDLEKLVGQNLDFVYVDIWGNNTGSNNDDSWQTRKLSKEINDNGWRMANEWGVANEYDATFQHWAADLTYGGFNQKGQNSEVMRFLRNHQKDSWVADYPKYGGAAMMPLLGGYNMKDFEGWQGRNDYDTYITNLFTHDVTTKFIQHYEIIKWVDGDPVSAGAATNWIPEMEITLKDDDGNKLVLTRGSNNPDDDAYRERTMTLNGKIVAKGAPSRGDRTDADIQNGRKRGTESYLLPWIWDSETGKKVAADDEKLYHWNTQGGTTTWDLPEGWTNLKDVKVYKLTDLGKTEEKTVEVKNGQVTLEAEAETPYVVCKGEEGNINVTWSEGMHITDAGFNGGVKSLEANWTKAGDGNAEIAKSQYSNPMLKLSGDISMTQELTNLKPGQRYAVLVGVDNRSDSKASVTVKADGNVLDTNYTEKSIAKNYVKAYTHSNYSATVDGSSYFQNMYVYFTAPESGKVTLTLAKSAGDGDTYFDDVRVVENNAQNITKDEYGNVVKFEQDFENNVQGIYPFVVSGIEGVEDNRIHLSELHAPYTQAGWDVKKMDDVLDGNWSVKVNGLTQRNTLAYQTIPQNFRFEPGVTYKVSFDYQTGSDDTYGVVVGTGEYKDATRLETLKKQMGPDQDGHYERLITGDMSGQTWFGIYSTGTAPDLQGTSGSEANFGGYKEIVLDNLVIERVDEDINKETLQGLIDKAEGLERTDYDKDAWKVLADAVVNAKVAVNKDKTDAHDIQTAYYEMKATLDYMEGHKLDPEAKNDISVKGARATAFSEDSGTYGSNVGKASYVLDGNTSTAWMTAFSGYGTTIKNNEGWIDIQYPEPHTVDGLRYLPGPTLGGSFTSITTYEISVKTADSDEYKVVATGDWANTAGWKTADFAPVENVTNIKLLAKAAKPTNWWAVAAEIRATSKSEAEAGNKPDAEVVNKDALNKQIEAVKALDKDNYVANDAWKTLEAKLAAAEKVSADKDATTYDVKLALANLKDALGDIQLLGADYSKVDAAIAKVPADLSIYTEESVAALNEALNAVNRDLDITKQSEVDKMAAAIKKAIANLKIAHADGLANEAAEDGNWYVYKDGSVDTTYTGLAANTYGWWYVEGGKVNFNATGLVANEYGWWYVQNGTIDFGYTGLAANEYGWWYVEGGKINFNHTGLVANEHGWWYVEDGKINFNATGLVANEYGWWYVQGGQINFNFNGIVANENGWWYVRNGMIDFNFNGLAANENGWWKFEGGKIDFNFNGAAQNENGWWYVRGGKIDFSYNGTVKVGGKTYTVTGGKLNV